MPKGNTTIKVSIQIAKHIESRAQGNESVDTTLRRLLGIEIEEQEVVKPPSNGMTIIKISRPVMERILKEAQDGESRNETLSRLLGMSRRNRDEHERRQHPPRGSVRDPGRGDQGGRHRGPDDDRTPGSRAPRVDDA